MNCLQNENDILQTILYKKQFKVKITKEEQKIYSRHYQKMRFQNTDKTKQLAKQKEAYHKMKDNNTPEYQHKLAMSLDRSRDKKDEIRIKAYQARECKEHLTGIMSLRPELFL